VGKALFIAVTQSVEGLSLAVGVSGRRSIVAATNGSQRVSCWNPRLKIVLSLWKGKYCGVVIRLI